MRLALTLVGGYLGSVVALWLVGSAVVGKWGLKGQRAIEQMLFLPSTGSGDFWVVQAVWSAVYAVPLTVLIALVQAGVRRRRRGGAPADR